jgi:hypothetical protein
MSTFSHVNRQQLAQGGLQGGMKVNVFECKLDRALGKHKGKEIKEKRNQLPLGQVILELGARPDHSENWCATKVLMHSQKRYRM